MRTFVRLIDVYGAINSQNYVAIETFGCMKTIMNLYVKKATKLTDIT